MNLQFLWHCQYPWDIRIEKMVQAVFNNMDVSVSIISKGGAGFTQTETYKKIHIHRIGTGSSLFSRLIYAPLFFNPVWFNTASKVIQQSLPTFALIVRDIPLAMTAIWLGRKFNIPVILDMAENYPAALISYENPIYKPFLIANAFIPRTYEQFVAQRMDHIIVVTDEQIDRLVGLGVAKEKLLVVQNTPDLDSFTDTLPKQASDLNDLQNFSPLMLYTGKIDKHRGVETMINALPLILKHFPKACLVLVGDGKEKNILEDLARTLGVDAHIIFTGWIKHNRLPAYINASTICCIPHLKSEHTDTTIPNKLYDYMAFGKPVVSSNLNPVKRIIEEVGCGKIFKAASSADFASTVIDLINTSNLNEMAQNGTRAVRERFNWNLDAANFITLLSNVHSSNARR